MIMYLSLASCAASVAQFVQHSAKNNLSEGTENFTVDLEPSNPDVQDGGPSTATVIIIDDESECIALDFP